MPELRRDPITHRWSIIATERALRPKDYELSAMCPNGQFDPFSAGNEHLTPPEIFAIRPEGSPANSSDWLVRVIPNKYPALRIEGDLEKRPHGLYDRMNGIGAHEVIIESPESDFKLHELDHAHLVQALDTYRERMADLQGDERLKSSLLFRNHGAAAGASVAHGHAQLIALPVVPHHVQELLDGAKRYFQFHDRSVFEDIVRNELTDGTRMVEQNEHFILAAPYASRLPFELIIIPRFQSPRFEATDPTAMGHLATILSSALRRLDEGLGDPSYNFVIQSAPYGYEDVPWYRWHLQITPKLTNVAGFELGTGFYINPTAPEEAAAFLRGLEN